MDTNPRFLGAWTLVSYELRSANGVTSLPLGRGARWALHVRRFGVWARRKDEVAAMTRFRLERDAWLPGRRSDIEMFGLEACLPLLGL